MSLVAALVGVGSTFFLVWRRVRARAAFLNLRDGLSYTCGVKQAFRTLKLRLGSSVAGLTVVTLLFAAVAQGGDPPPVRATQTAHLTLDVTLSYAQEGSITLQYRLTNVGETPFVVDPSDLQVLYGEADIPYKLVHSPAPGRANRLSQGEAESGTITVSDPPHDSDNLLLMWSVLEIGPNTEHILLKRFGDMILKSEGAAVQTPGKQGTLSVEVQRRVGSARSLSPSATACIAQSFTLAVDLVERSQAEPVPSVGGSIWLHVSGRKLV